MDLGVFVFIFFFKQKTAYEMRISDWSSDVCSSDLARTYPRGGPRRCVQQCGRYLYRADDHIPPRYIRRQGRRHARAAGCSKRTRLESAGRLQHGPKLSRPTQGQTNREFRPGPSRPPAVIKLRTMEWPATGSKSKREQPG